MYRKKIIRKLISGREGGIDSIIAMIVGIILVLGLISYAVLGQVAGAKDTGNKAMIEQDKINLMLQNPNIVTGNIVKSYYEQRDQGRYSVVILRSDNETDLPITEVVDGALFKESKNYDADGHLLLITYTQVDLSR